MKYRRRLSGLLALLLALAGLSLLSACAQRSAPPSSSPFLAQTRLVVQPGGSLDGSITIGFNPTAWPSADVSERRLVQQGLRQRAVDEITRANAEPPHPGVEFTLVDDEHLFAVRATFRDVPFAEFDVFLGSLGRAATAATDAPGSALQEALDLEFSYADAELLQVRGVLGAKAANLSLPAPVAVTLEVVFPGEVIVSDGAVSGTEVAWSTALGREVGVQAQASSVRPLALPLVAGGALVLVSAAAALWLLFRSGTGRTAPPPPSESRPR